MTRQLHEWRLKHKGIGSIFLGLTCIINTLFQIEQIDAPFGCIAWQGNLQGFVVSVLLCSPQWRSFFQVLSLEWSAELPVAQLHAQMVRRGGLLADLHPLPAADGLAELELAMNEVWVRLQWGWVRLHDQGDALRLVHRAAPLVEAFGPMASGWSVGLLEGMYQRWLQRAGAQPGLRVRLVNSVLQPPSHEFLFTADAAPAAAAGGVFPASTS